MVRAPHRLEAEGAVAVRMVQLGQGLERRLAQQREDWIAGRGVLVRGVAEAAHHRRDPRVVQAFRVRQGQRRSRGGVVVVEDDAERDPNVLAGLVVERPRRDVQRHRRLRARVVPVGHPEALGVHRLQRLQLLLDGFRAAAHGSFARSSFRGFVDDARVCGGTRRGHPHGAATGSSSWPVWVVHARREPKSHETQHGSRFFCEATRPNSRRMEFS